MNEQAEAMKRRTKTFAVRVLRLVEALPPGRTADIIGRQLLRSATSVGANYRAACRGRSGPEFCAKLGIVEEEADESAYWMELLMESGIVKEDRLTALLAEAHAITAITVASIKTARSNHAVRAAAPRSPQ